tara:strand:- start:3151 stop:3981 length:831 start_codon:yes stop_codon:yes gene_type:complete
MGQEGFLYEANVANALKKKKFGLVKGNYVPAGASSDRPDLDLTINGVDYGCELKKDLADAGSLVIKYNNSRNDVRIGDTGGSKEKEFMKSLGEKNGVLTAIKRQWLQGQKRLWIAEDRDAKWLKRWEQAGRPNVEERYKQDLENSKDILFNLPDTSIEKYYNLKDTYYINVGTHGFYLLGPKDPGKMQCTAPKVPLWSRSHKCVLRVRIQPKGVSKALLLEKRNKKPTGSQGYQITMSMTFKAVKKSPYNIGPVVKGSAVVMEHQITLPDSHYKTE